MNHLDTQTQNFLQQFNNDSVSLPEVQEIEDRLGLSKYYKSLLENGLFEIKNDFSNKVESEVRQFIVARLQELLGVKTNNIKTATDFPFTSEEVGVLKALSRKLLDNSQKSDSQEPQLKTVRDESGSPILLKTNKSITLKSKEANKTSSVVAKSNIKKRGVGALVDKPVVDGALMPTLPSNHPLMPNEQQMAMWAQNQVLGAGAVVSSSTQRS